MIPEMLPVIYEDFSIIAVNKPAGISVHKTHPEDRQRSLADILLEQFPYLSGIGEYPDRPGMMHRLDKDTSGILLIAKNQQAYDYCKTLFQTRKIRKYYLALVIGHPKAERGTIDAPIGRIGMKRTTIVRHGKLKDKKESVTEYTTVRAYDGFTLLEVLPKTGRTHQIRVHMKHIGNPVAGDPLYAPKNAPRPEGLTRLFLHARKLEFTSPDGRALALEADLPPDLQTILENLPGSEFSG